MAYHVLIACEGLPGKPVFDKYLGTASIVDTYWESVGRRLSLPIISGITERADSEEGFVLEKESLAAFKDELVELEKFWKSADIEIAVPDGFFDDIEEIRKGVEEAITKHLKLMIG
ncbi:MAG: hypothetical protein PVJ68_19535 [Candidatus Thiodiazotropha sp.]